MTTFPESSEQHFHDYLERLALAVGHTDRNEPLQAYLVGLCLPGERKSIEPMAARIDPRHVSARHQSMHHFIAKAPWDDDAVLRVARDTVLDTMERHGAIAGWIIDDTGIPKKGRHSVGVARQYCGVLGKQDNCQVAVSLSLANEAVSVPAGYRLYLPESWAVDKQRRRVAGIPGDVAFQTKWQIALELLDTLIQEGIPAAPVIADAGYGVVTELRDQLTARGLPYIMGVSKETTVWPPGSEPMPPKRWSGQGRPPTKIRRGTRRKPVAIKDLAAGLARNQWRQVSWRQGTKGTMRSRFAWMRVRPAHRDEQRDLPREVEWLLMEWPHGESSPTKFWLSTMPPDTPAVQLVRLAKLRWRVERDYEELKGEFGLDHYEGRGWRGFHHHGVLCIAAYAFLAAERARLSPPEPLSFLHPVGVPEGFRPRGSASAA